MAHTSDPVPFIYAGRKAVDNKKRQVIDITTSSIFVYLSQGNDRVACEISIKEKLKCYAKITIRWME